ncbi:lymphocyte antigen 6L [Rhinolophus sinicus]|uniref:lymphocyte antigen 6L n=1 Tax=Rhinolophus sinicus TaxID=89399 RepID=UPI003D7A069E
MEALVLVLWALLVSAEFAGGTTQPSVNLSCYQCFKVTKEAMCKPAECSPTDRVCVSNALFVYSKSKVKMLLSKRCAPRCPNTNMKYEWSSGSEAFNRIIRQCCVPSLCNRAPATWEGPWAQRRQLLLPLAIGLLWTLLQLSFVVQLSTSQN